MPVAVANNMNAMISYLKLFFDGIYFEIATNCVKYYMLAKKIIFINLNQGVNAQSDLVFVRNILLLYKTGSKLSIKHTGEIQTSIYIESEMRGKNRNDDLKRFI